MNGTRITKEFNTLTTHYVVQTDTVKEPVIGVLGRNITADVIRVRFHRYAIFYILQGYVPNIITVTLAWFSFMIKPDAYPARISILVSSLIAIMLQYANLVKSIPRVGYFKAIDLWMLCCVVFIFLASLEYALICLLKRLPTKVSSSTLARIDRIASALLFSAFLTFACLYFSLTCRD